VNLTGRALVITLVCLQFFGYTEHLKADGDAPASQKTLAEFRVATQGDIILLPVTFKGREYSFMFDTGTSVTAFDASLKHELGSAKGMTKIGTAAGPMSVQLFDAPEAFLGPLNLQDCGQVTCVDLRMFGPVLGREVGGVIGMDFLKNRVVQIDFDEGMLRFISPATDLDDSLGEVLPMRVESRGQPWVEGTVFDRIKVDFLIDTGMTASGELATQILRDALRDRVGVGRTSETLTQTPSGAVRKMIFRAGCLSIGSSRYEHLIFRPANMSSLGLQFLSRHIVTFDFPKSRVHLKEGVNFKKVDEADMSGLHLLLVSNQVLVQSVDVGSPAEKVGIKANDLVLRVQGKDASTYGISRLRRFLKSDDGLGITMTIRRGNEEKDVSFRLERRI
jgi:hypothetical protein